MTHTDAPAPRFAGQEVNLGGTMYVVPPLALGALKQLLPKIKALTIGEDLLPDLSQVVDLLEICLAALRRNYPALTLEELGDIVDLGNFKTLVAAVMGAVGPRGASRAGGKRLTGRRSARLERRLRTRQHDPRLALAHDRCRDGSAAADGVSPLLGPGAASARALRRVRGLQGTGRRDAAETPADDSEALLRISPQPASPSRRPCSLHDVAMTDGQDGHRR
jgi:hypothetical protein